jgi:hypothetical protein
MEDDKNHSLFCYIATMGQLFQSIKISQRSSQRNSREYNDFYTDDDDDHHHVDGDYVSELWPPMGPLPIPK